MKPPPFDHLAAGSVGEAVAVLARDDGAKVLAGGQSLVPLLALRLARPTVLVDVNGLGLDTVEVIGNELVLGSMVRHRRLERDPLVQLHAPLLARAASLIGHPAIRHRGTLGGSIVHADPVAELPAALLALGGTVVAEGPDGRRTVRADQLFEGFLTTSLSSDELLVEARVPVAEPGHGAAFAEWAPRSHDFAVAGVGVALVRRAGAVSTVRAAACGVGATPVDLGDAFAPIIGSAVTPAAAGEVRRRVRATCAAAGEDTADLAGVLASRALLEAAA